MNKQAVAFAAAADQCAKQCKALEAAKSSLWKTLVATMLLPGADATILGAALAAEGVKKGTYSAYLSQITAVLSIGLLRADMGQREVATAIKDARKDGALPPARGGKSAPADGDGSAPAPAPGALRVEFRGIDPESVGRFVGGVLVIDAESLASLRSGGPVVHRVKRAA